MLKQCALVQALTYMRRFVLQAFALWNTTGIGLKTRGVLLSWFLLMQ